MLAEVEKYYAYYLVVQNTHDPYVTWILFYAELVYFFLWLTLSLMDIDTFCATANVKKHIRRNEWAIYHLLIKIDSVFLYTISNT